MICECNVNFLDAPPNGISATGHPDIDVMATNGTARVLGVVLAPIDSHPRTQWNHVGVCSYFSGMNPGPCRRTIAAVTWAVSRCDKRHASYHPPLFAVS